MSQALDRLAAQRGEERFPQGVAEALQQEILEYAERYLKKLKANEALHSILELKPPVETPKYATRFKHEVWANALRLVRKITDKPGSPPLRPQWRLDSPAQHVCENPMATMVQAFCDEILKLTDYPRPPSRDEIHVLQRTIQKTLSELFGITFDANGTEESPEQFCAKYADHAEHRRNGQKFVSVGF